MRTFLALPVFLVGCSTTVGNQLGYTRQVNTVSVVQLRITDRVGEEMGRMWVESRRIGVEMGACIYGFISVIPDSLVPEEMRSRIWYRLTIDSLIPFRVVVADSVGILQEPCDRSYFYVGTVHTHIAIIAPYNTPNRYPSAQDIVGFWLRPHDMILLVVWGTDMRSVGLSWVLKHGLSGSWQWRRE